MIENSLTQLVAQTQKVPTFLRQPMLSFFIGRVIKFVGTAKLSITNLNQAECSAVLKNRNRVQNHIGTVHAAAMALLAETVTGLVLGMNVPNNRIPLIKSLKVNYVKRAKGDLQARAWLTEEQIGIIEQQEKGELLVQVKVFDEENNEPIECEMVWAWIPKK